MTMAVETLLSLRGEWRPPSPASSVVSDNTSSPLRVVREEVVSCTDGGEVEECEAMPEAQAVELPHLPVPNVVSRVVFALNASTTHAGLVFGYVMCFFHYSTL